MTFFIFFWILCSLYGETPYRDENGGWPNYVTATSIASATSTLSDGWYDVQGYVTIAGTGSLSIPGGQAVNVILKDECSLTVAGISGTGSGSTTLNIYGQNSGNGRLTSTIAEGTTAAPAGISVSILTISFCRVFAKGGYGSPGIGGRYGFTFIIYGGEVEATGGTKGAGIGGTESGGGGSVTIEGGKVTAVGGVGASGIGGGVFGLGGFVAINGGTVIAKGGTNGGSGIGGGSDKGGGTVIITGGSVKASATGTAVAIGAGQSGTNHGTLKNGDGINVYLNTLKFPSGVIPQTVAAAVISDIPSYGMKDVSTDSDRAVYFYLPPSDGEKKVTLTVGGKNYDGEYTRQADHNNVKDLVLSCTYRTPAGSPPCGLGACFQDIGGANPNKCVTSCTATGYDEDTSTGKCEPEPEPGPEPEPQPEPEPESDVSDTAAPLKRSLALAVIVAAIVWLM